VNGERIDIDDSFSWSTDRGVLTLSLEGDTWNVVYASEGVLFGPRQVVYEATHRQANRAVWDVLARVTKATHDDEEGVRVAQSAARWMRSVGKSRSVPLLFD
jgi:hypothetical protein